MNEHDYEPIPGLPAPLPPGESILWQGAPCWRSMALRAMRVRQFAIYFAILAAWGVLGGLSSGTPALDVALSTLRLGALAVLALALLALFAWLVARTTLYTITSRRVVMRVGIALPMTLQIPFGRIHSADLRSWADATGDISLTLSAGERVAYLVLWPHTRPWKIARPLPTLRGRRRRHLGRSHSRPRAGRLRRTTGEERGGSPAGRGRSRCTASGSRLTETEMSHASSAPSFPRGALLAAGAAIALSIALAAAGRMSGAANSEPTAAPVIDRQLLFKDLPNGGIAVFDANHPGAPIDTFAPETNGFLRATMRGLARQRLRQSEGAETPFRLTEWADGRLTLTDPATGRRVEMEAFGITNESVFARLLTAQAGNAMIRLDVPCVVDIEHTAESLHAHAIPEGIAIHPGDTVLVRGAPSGIGFGQRARIECVATVMRAGVFGRWQAKLSGLLALGELFEVGFQPKEP